MIHSLDDDDDDDFVRFSLFKYKGCFHVYVRPVLN